MNWQHYKHLPVEWIVWRDRLGLPIHGMHASIAWCNVASQQTTQGQHIQVELNSYCWLSSDIIMVSAYMWSGYFITRFKPCRCVLIWLYYSASHPPHTPPRQTTPLNKDITGNTSRTPPPIPITLLSLASIVAARLYAHVRGGPDNRVGQLASSLMPIKVWDPILAAQNLVAYYDKSDATSCGPVLSDRPLFSLTSP